MVMDVNWIYCSDHFTMYADVELPCRTLEIDIMNVDHMLHVSKMGNKVICSKRRG